jgi:hypothetical protein
VEVKFRAQKVSDPGEVTSDGVAAINIHRGKKKEKKKRRKEYGFGSISAYNITTIVKRSEEAGARI